MTHERETFVSFGSWVQRRRKALDLTQAKLAQQIGCSVVTIKKIEQELRRPSLQMAKLLADQLLISDAERERFLGLARGKFVPSMPSPLAAVALPPFLPSKESSSSAADGPFVARDQVLAGLAAVLKIARAGTGQILFVIGGAGRGKTTVVQEFARRAQADDHDLLVASAFCHAHTGLGDPYLPFRELLTMLTGDVETRWVGGLISPQQAGRLWQAMPVTIPALIEQAPELIDTFVPGQALQTRAAAFAPNEAVWYSRLTKLTANRPTELIPERIFSQYTAVLKTIALRHPLLLIIEDLHWVDPSSSSLLFHLSRHISDSPILIVGTYRPDEVALSRAGERHPLANMVGELKRQHGDIWLDLAEVTDGRAFVDAFLDTQPNRLGESFRQALLAHTGGHALFTVELLRNMQERGDLQQSDDGHWIESAVIDWRTLPPKVEGVIEQRINRLEDELKSMLTIASVVGEFFTAEVVARVQAVSARQLVQRLSQELDREHRLVTAAALEWRGRQRMSVYRFRHNLFQHYLYTHLDETERSYLHEEVGNALEALYGDQTDEIAVQLAWHFQEAGITAKAVDFLQQAGERAVRLSAHEEAISHLTQGLGLLRTLPETPARVQQELKLQITLGVPLTATRTFAAPEVEQAYSRARELCRQLGETAQLFPVLFGLRMFYSVRAEHPTARDLAEQCLRLAQEQQEPELLLPAQWGLGFTGYYLGELVAARTHLEQARILYDPQQHHKQAFLYGFDSGVVSLSYGALSLALLGYPDQARQRSQEALALAQAVSHPYSLAASQFWATWLHYLRREWPAIQERTEAVITLATEQGFRFWLATGTILRGAGLVERGEFGAGVAQLRQGLAATLSAGATVARSWFLALLAEAYGKGGQPEEGLTVLAEALMFVEQNNERFWEADLYRLRGELLLRQGQPEAEACFWQAMEVARRQEAKLLELRAAVSLCRLLQKQGRGEEGRPMLSVIYNWFTEGFDTLDLIEARKLLKELHSA